LFFLLHPLLLFFREVLGGEEYIFGQINNVKITRFEQKSSSNSKTTRESHQPTSNLPKTIQNSPFKCTNARRRDCLEILAQLEAGPAERLFKRFVRFTTLFLGTQKAEHKKYDKLKHCFAVCRADGGDEVEL